MQAHIPEVQILPGSHTVPHVPQFALSVAGVTHTPLQEI
jgi:hypothetical protein